jgi:hypothetical protein
MRKLELVERLVATALAVVLLAACGRDDTTTAVRDDPTTIVEGTGSASNPSSVAAPGRAKIR